MTDDNNKNKGTFCSFCNKSNKDAGTLVEGANDVFICGDCVELCQGVLKREHQKRANAIESDENEKIRNTLWSTLRERFKARFREIPKEVEKTIQQETNSLTLEAWAAQAATCQSLDDFSNALTAMSKAKLIETLHRELYYIAEAIATCNGLLTSVQIAKAELKQQCDDYLDEMSLSKEEWRLNLLQIGTIEQSMQTVINRCLQMQNKLATELANLDNREGGGDFEGSTSPVRR